MRRTVSLYGLATLQADRQLPLNLLSQHHSPLCRHSQPLRLNLSLLHLPLTLNADSSRSCSVIWSIPPSCHRSSTQKTGVTWCGHISGCVLKSSSATMVISHNCSEMDSLCTSAIPKPMKMTPNEQYGRGWEFLLPWE